MLILASKSPTRKTLLENAGLRFSVVPAAIDERAIEEGFGQGTLDGMGVARELAAAKALAVSSIHPGALVIGADQTLSCAGRAYHKPADRAAAASQLRALRGRTHTLNAGVALARAGRILWRHGDIAELTMRDFSEGELERVLDLEGEAILESVGAYRLEGPSVRLFSRIDGSWFTVMGLPLLALLAALRELAPHSLDEREES